MILKWTGLVNIKITFLRPCASPMNVRQEFISHEVRINDGRSNEVKKA